jgi:hypothetical protein
METMTGNGVVYEVHAVMCDVLSKAEQYVTYREVLSTTECITF